MAREMNDHLATAIARHPDRLAGFATLPMQCPDACADELVRAVKDLRFVGTLINGTTEGRFLDHPMSHPTSLFWHGSKILGCQSGPERKPV